jgi:hypothetical protein
VVLSGGGESDDRFMAHCIESPLGCEGTEETDCAEESEIPEEAGSTNDSVGDGDPGLKTKENKGEE